MIYQGYYLQAISFFLISGFLLFIYGKIRSGKMSGVDTMPFLPSSSTEFEGSSPKSRHLFSWFNWDNFDLLEEVKDDDRSLWASVRREYYLSLLKSSGIRVLPSRYLLLLNKKFPLLDSIIPFMLVTGFALLFLIGWPTLMILSVELVNYITILTAAILLLSFQIPIKAYHNFIRERNLSSTELREIKALYFLLHLSLMFRLWSFYWQMKNIVLWFFKNDESVRETHAS